MANINPMDNANPFLLGEAAQQQEPVDVDVMAHEPAVNNDINIPLEDDRDLVIDVIADADNAVTGLRIVLILLLGNSALSLMTFLVSKRCDASTSSRGALPNVIRRYTKQVCFCNSIVAVVNVLALYWLEARSAEDMSLRPVCANTFDELLLGLVVLVVSVFVSFVRFMAFIYAFETNQAKEKLPQTQQNAFSGGSAPIVLGSVCTLLKIGIVFFLLELAVLFELVPASVHDFINFTVCVDSLPSDYFSLFVFLVVVLCQMQFGVLVSELFYTRKMKVGLQFLHLVLQSEFCATAFALNTFGLYSLLVLMWFMGVTALQCLVFAQLFVTIDTFWVFVVCCATPNQQKLTDISKM